MMIFLSEKETDLIPEMTWDQIWNYIKICIKTGTAISVDFPKEAEDEYEE